MEGGMWKVFGLAAAIRLLFLRLRPIVEIVENRIEVSNSQIGIKAVHEAIFLADRGVPIYQNPSSCQPSPLIISVIRFSKMFWIEDLLFTGLDLLAALFIFKIVEKLKERATRLKEMDAPPSDYDPLLFSSMYKHIT